VDCTDNETVKQNKKENGILKTGNKTFQMWNERREMAKETNSTDMKTLQTKSSLDKRNL
jgi:hypothetical protein